MLYHFLGRALGQQISISQVVDLNVLDEIAVGDIHVGLHLMVARVRRVRACGFDRGNVDMLRSFARLQLSVDLGSGRSYFGQISLSTLAITRAHIALPQGDAKGTYQQPRQHLRQASSSRKVPPLEEDCDLSPHGGAKAESESACRIWRLAEAQAPFGRSGIAWFVARNPP